MNCNSRGCLIIFRVNTQRHQQAGGRHGDVVNPELASILSGRYKNRQTKGFNKIHWLTDVITETDWR
jgi:hypothetical protein